MDFQRLIHVVMAIFATWRITELIVADEIFKPIRNRWPGYFWTCSRCVSVWAGIMATAIFYLLPFLNWPLAFSSIYLTAAMLVAKMNDDEKQRISIYPEQKRWNWGKFNIHFALSIMKQIILDEESKIEKPVMQHANGGR